MHAGKKWRFLEHNGVIFPPKYEPHGVKMMYDGKEVDLNAEQVAAVFCPTRPHTCAHTLVPCVSVCRPTSVQGLQAMS